MFGLSFTEILVIAALALIVIGPERLPGVARAIGKGFAEFKGALDDVKRDVVDEIRPPGNQSDYINKLLADRKVEKAKAGLPPATDAEPVAIDGTAQAGQTGQESQAEPASGAANGTVEGGSGDNELAEGGSGETSSEEAPGWQSPYEPSKVPIPAEPVAVAPAPPPKPPQSESPPSEEDAANDEEPQV